MLRLKKNTKKGKLNVPVVIMAGGKGTRMNSDKEKLATIEQLRASDAGAGNNPARKEVIGKWAKTDQQIVYKT